MVHVIEMEEIDDERLLIIGNALDMRGDEKEVWTGRNPPPWLALYYRLNPPQRTVTGMLLINMNCFASCRCISLISGLC